jgi:hypothetical protein
VTFKPIASGLIAVLVAASAANATPMSGLPAAGAISATDTLSLCQKATGCGTTDPLHQATAGAFLGGTVTSPITGATTLGNGANDVIIPVTGSGYTITLPQTTSTLLAPGSVVRLVPAQGAGPVDVCPGSSSSVFDASSGAPLVPNICPSGQSGIPIWSGLQLQITTEGSGNYYALLSEQAVSSVNPQAYFVDPANGNDGNLGGFGNPFQTITKCVAIASTSNVKTCYLRHGFYNLSAYAVAHQCSGISQAVYINNASGITISYYPPDGLGSAILDGGSSSASTGMQQAFCIDGTVTGVSDDQIIGLTFDHFTGGALTIVGASSPVGGTGNAFKWNFVTNEYYVACCIDPVMAGGYLPGLQVSNNYFANGQRNGIELGVTLANGLNGAVVNGNVFENFCASGNTDCGAIYFQATNGSTSCTAGTVTITDNYVNKTNGSGGGNAIYLDSDMCGATATGNVMVGNGNYCVQIHGGSNNVFTGNVCDLGGGGAGATTTQDIVFYQQTTPSGTPMTGNAWENNLIVCNSSASPCGNGYVGSVSPPNPMTVANNAYHNYGSGTGGAGGVNDGCSSGACSTGDTNPSAISSPGISCWAALISLSSPLLTSPISMAPLGYAWGPPGLIGTSQMSGSNITPSWGGSC